MYPRRFSRIPKASKKSPQRSPTDEEVIQRRLRGRRRGTWLRKPGDRILDMDEGRERDIIDIINSSCDVEHVAEEDAGESVEVADKGLDEWDEDRASVCSSVASGPSLLYHATPKKPRPSQGLCSACRKLCQKAKRTKAPIKNKLLDNDPKSLTCDQWVLIKKWTPRRLPNARGKLLSYLQLHKEVRVKRSEPCVQAGESSACSRPHTFLQRNLRQCVKVPAKRRRKKNRRKRTRDDSQGSRAAKQQRLHGNSPHQSPISQSMISINSPDDDPNRCHSVEGCSGQETDDQADTDLTVELIPSSVTLETTNPREIRPKQKAPKKARGFRDLLAQLRGSMIVKETH